MYSLECIRDIPPSLSLLKRGDQKEFSCPPLPLCRRLSCHHRGRDSPASTQLLTKKTSKNMVFQDYFRAFLEVRRWSCCVHCPDKVCCKGCVI